MHNTIEDLRTHLFDTLRDLRDPKNPMDLERAKTVAKVAAVVIETAKVEVKFAEATGERIGTGFLPQAEPPGPRALPAAAGNGLAPLRPARRQ